MITDAGRRLANQMFKATRGRSGKSLFNTQAMMNQGAPAQPENNLPTLDDLLPDVFKQASPQGQNLTNITRRFGGTGATNAR